MPGKTIAFDLDGTLCTRPDGIEHLGPKKYNHCVPNQEMINVLNDLYDNGNTILIYTARGMGQFKGNVHKVHIELYELTLASLREWGVKHHGLIMGKIDFDMLIDDKAMGINDIEKIKSL